MRSLEERGVTLQEQASRGPDTSGRIAPTYPDGLSQREIEVLRLITAGKSNREIADELIISPNTVANHVRNIFNKTNAANRTEVATYAIRHGLMTQ
jgi:DNA-binding NarL/FixJ family response regulator